MAISTGTKCKCSQCGYTGEDLELKVTTNGIAYYICPNCELWVKYGRKSKEKLAKLGLKFNRAENKLERIENAKEEENRNTGIEANSTRNNNTDRDTERSSWNPFGD